MSSSSIKIAGVFLAAATLAAFPPATSAAGDPAGYAGFSVLDLSDELGTPEGLTTYRVIAHFEGEEIQVLGAGAGTGARREFVVVTSDPKGIQNFGGILAGTTPEDFPGAPFSDPWDSWVTIEVTEFISQWLRFDQGFLGAIPPVISGNSLWEPDSTGWIMNQPGQTFDTSDVPIAQFTVADDASLHLEIHVYWTRPGINVVNDRIRWNNGAEPIERDIPSCARADIDGDGTVGFSDVLTLVAEWGVGSPTWQPIGHHGSVFSEIQGCSFELPPVVDAQLTGTGSVDLVQASSLGGSAIDATYGVRIAADPRGVGTQLTLRADATLTASDDCPVGTPARGWLDFDAGYDLEVLEPTDYRWAVSCTPGPVLGLATVSESGTIEEFVASCVTNSEGTLAPGTYRLFVRDELAFEAGDGDTNVAVEGTLQLLNPTAPGTTAAWRDIDGDGSVGMDDLMAILSTWGPACPG